MYERFLYLVQYWESQLKISVALYIYEGIKVCYGGRETWLKGATYVLLGSSLPLKIASIDYTSEINVFSCCLSLTCPEYTLLMFSLQIITPCRKLILCADNRKEMEDWIAALKTVQNREHFEVIGKGVPLHSVPHLLNNSLF